MKKIFKMQLALKNTMAFLLQQTYLNFNYKMKINKLTRIASCI